MLDNMVIILHVHLFIFFFAPQKFIHKVLKFPKGVNLAPWSTLMCLQHQLFL